MRDMLETKFLLQRMENRENADSNPIKINYYILLLLL